MDAEAPTATPESPVAEIATVNTAGVSAGATQGTAEVGQSTAAVPAATEELLTIMGTQIPKSKVPPELLEKVDNWNKSYTQSRQELAESKKRAEAFDQLRGHEGFQKWYRQQVQAEMAAQNGQLPPQAQGADNPFTLTPEKQAELLSDPKAFQDYIQNYTLSLIQQVALPQSRAAHQEARTLRDERTVEQLAAKFNGKDGSPAFDDLNNTGKIDEVLAKYAKRGTDLDLEDAYWLAARPTVESSARLKAQQRVQEKANGTTLPPSGGGNSGVKIVPAKGLSFSDKLKIAAEAGYRGDKIQFDSTR